MPISGRRGLAAFLVYLFKKLLKLATSLPGGQEQTSFLQPHACTGGERQKGNYITVLRARESELTPLPRCNEGYIGRSKLQITSVFRGRYIFYIYPCIAS